MTHLASLTNIHEADSPLPWKIGDAPADYIATLAKGIVGLEMTIERLEGKWKVSQNRSEQDRNGIAKGLAELNTAKSLEMKTLVERRDSPRKAPSDESR
jgi:transcriptional regulator